MADCVGTTILDSTVCRAGPVVRSFLLGASPNVPIAGTDPFMVDAYRRESQRQQLLTKNAKVTEEKLLFVVTAFTKLFADENFMNLLRAESLATVPKYLWEKIGSKYKEAA